jgi:hypothetical protein
MLAAVERKSLDNLAATLADGTLAFQLQRLAELPLAAVVVEARYSALYKLEHVHGKAAETTLTSSGASSRTPSQRIGNCDPYKQVPAAPSTRSSEAKVSRSSAPRFARRGQARSPNAGSAPSAATASTGS